MKIIVILTVTALFWLLIVLVVYSVAHSSSQDAVDEQGVFYCYADGETCVCDRTVDKVIIDCPHRGMLELTQEEANNGRAGA